MNLDRFKEIQELCIQLKKILGIEIKEYLKDNSPEEIYFEDITNLQASVKSILEYDVFPIQRSVN